MADLFASTLGYLSAAMQGNASQSVTYMRGSQPVGSALKATYGQTIHEQDSQFGILRWESKDFIFTAADLTLDGNVIEPQRGDKITDHLGNVFQVLGDNGEPCFRYADPYRTTIRVHTKSDS